MIAVEHSDLEIIQLRLGFGADANSQDHRNGSVLQAAAIRLSSVSSSALRRHFKTKRRELG
jgi:hypothetical protein